MSYYVHCATTNGYVVVTPLYIISRKYLEFLTEFFFIECSKAFVVYPFLSFTKILDYFIITTNYLLTVFNSFQVVG